MDVFVGAAFVFLSRWCGIPNLLLGLGFFKAPLLRLGAVTSRSSNILLGVSGSTLGYTSMGTHVTFSCHDLTTLSRCLFTHSVVLGLCAFDLACVNWSSCVSFWVVEVSPHFGLFDLVFGRVYLRGCRLVADVGLVPFLIWNRGSLDKTAVCCCS